MSAESSRLRQTSLTILPQPVTDKSIIDSVAGFIHEVVPPAYTNVLHGENKERIAWAAFERADLFDPFYFSESSDLDAYDNSPLLLIVGYNVGAKIWSISINGEATEVLSLSDSVVKCLRLLPSPFSCSVSESCRKQDLFVHKRPLIALCDNAGSSVPYCLVNFISLRTGESVKAIQFKTQVCDIQANRRSIAVIFSERIAVFDAFTLEDRLTVTTCFPSPSINPNPVALGSRWLAYSEKQLILQKRSRGGSEGEGVQSYTATVLQAAKTLSKGLRDFSGSVTSSLTGTGPVPNGSNSLQPGIITILDVESSNGTSTKDKRGGEIIAHFIAHSEPIVAMNFDPSGMLLITADKRGHRFNVFRINPHVAGSACASVHHLYILHRGDTTARVQDISFSNDSRWVAVSSLRGTTHVFPITPYGGAVGLRTHATPHVVNKMSRFHRSAGLINDGRNSPILNECNQQLQQLAIPNPCLPPFPSPIVITPLAQLRTYPPGIPATSRHEDISALIRVSACFAPPRAWLSLSRETIMNSKSIKRAVDSLFIITCHANLIQYDLEPKHVVGVSKDKVCDNTQIELGVEAKAEWPLVNSTSNIQPPLSANNPLLLMNRPLVSNSSKKYKNLDSDERWLSQVEIVTHAGPHRRLWMGPQFTFKTFSSSTGATVSVMDSDGGSRLNRSSPVNMPLSHSPIVPVLLESGSSSSFEQSPCLLDLCGSESEKMEGEGDSRLQEDLADAMQEGPGIPIPSDAGGRSMRARASVMARQVNPLGTVLTLSEGVSVAASIKTPVSNRKISKVVCCEEQSSHLPSSFDCPVTLDLSRTYSETAIDLPFNEKVIYLDRTQASSKLSSSSSSSPSSVPSTTLSLKTEKTTKENLKTDLIIEGTSKISTKNESTVKESSELESSTKTRKNVKNSSKTEEKSTRVLSQSTESVVKTSDVVSSKNSKADAASKTSVSEESAGKNARAAKSKNKKDKARGIKQPVEVSKYEDQPSGIEDSTQENYDNDLVNVIELPAEVKNESSDLNAGTISNPSKNNEQILPSVAAQSPPEKPQRKNKKKESIQSNNSTAFMNTTVPATTTVNPLKGGKTCEISVEKDDIMADSIIISNYPSDEETASDDIFESFSFKSDEQVLKPKDPMVIKSCDVSICEEHFSAPTILGLDALELNSPVLKKSEVPQQENLVTEGLDSSISKSTDIAFNVEESWREVPCYVEKKSQESNKPIPGRGGRNSKKGKASNQKREMPDPEKCNSETPSFSAESCSELINDEILQDCKQLASSSSNLQANPNSNVEDFETVNQLHQDEENFPKLEINLTENFPKLEINLTVENQPTSSVSDVSLVNITSKSAQNKSNSKKKSDPLKDAPLFDQLIEPSVEYQQSKDSNEELAVSSSTKVAALSAKSKKNAARKARKNKNNVQNLTSKDVASAENLPAKLIVDVSQVSLRPTISLSDVLRGKIPTSLSADSISGLKFDVESSPSVSQNHGDVEYLVDCRDKDYSAVETVESNSLHPEPSEGDCDVLGLTINPSCDSEVEAPLQFDLQSSNAHEPHSLNEDYQSLTAEDLMPFNVGPFEEQNEFENEFVIGNEAENLQTLDLTESGSDFFIPQPLFGNDENTVDYVEITSMIVDDNMCPAVRKLQESNCDFDELTEPVDRTFEDLDDTVIEKLEMVSVSEPIIESNTFEEIAMEPGDKKVSSVSAVDDPLNISELMLENDETTENNESTVPESTPMKKEATPVLSSRRNRKEKGRKSRGRR